MNVGTLNLDITIEECSSCKNLVVRDDSYYLDTPESPTITISLPGYNTAKVLDFDDSKINIFNSYTLGLSKSAATDKLIDLPDGLYTIVYAICPFDDFNIKVYYLRTCKAWCMYDTYLKQIFDSCLNVDPVLSQKLQHVEWLLKGGVAFAKDCNPDKAILLYKKALELLEDVKCQLGILGIKCI